MCCGAVGLTDVKTPLPLPSTYIGAPSVKRLVFNPLTKPKVVQNAFCAPVEPSVITPNVVELDISPIELAYLTFKFAPSEPVT